MTKGVGGGKESPYSFPYKSLSHKSTPPSPSEVSPKSSASLGALLAPDGDQHPTRVSSKYSSIASVTPSFLSFLTAGALGCSNLQSFTTRSQSLWVWGAHALHSMKR